ncbi:MULTISPECIES: hypothetical protein [unclassified Mycolicibacterium]|uniref:hypothetical protein n=1 Tax=unclassified Mycolicibacterium TaxID=2636767 RepID=UPI00192E48C3|nr:MULTISPECIES: hypothetical protein [unclassified Mycolicibacterium]
MQNAGDRADQQSGAALVAALGSGDAKPIPAWVTELGIVDRPTGLVAAKASLSLLSKAGATALKRTSPNLTIAATLMCGLVTRAVGLHQAAVDALEKDNPYAAFTLIRAYAENAAAFLYANDKPDKVGKMLGLNGNSVKVGQITSHATQSKKFGAFKQIYSELSEYGHPQPKSFSASMVIEGNRFQWSSTPAFRATGNDFVMACAWVVELAEVHTPLILGFADVQGWPAL